MAMNVGSDADDEIMSEINTTPLVDVMLVLLIIFLITIPVVTTSIKVDLPKAATGEETAASTLAITLTRDGSLFVNGKATTEEGLILAVQEGKAKQADIQALIAADQDVSHGRVVRVLDLVQSNGVSRFAINIEPSAEGSSAPGGR